VGSCLFALSSYLVKKNRWILAIKRNRPPSCVLAEGMGGILSAVPSHNARLIITSYPSFHSTYVLAPSYFPAIIRSTLDLWAGSPHLRMSRISSRKKLRVVPVCGRWPAFPPAVTLSSYVPGIPRAPVVSKFTTRRGRPVAEFFSTQRESVSNHPYGTPRITNVVSEGIPTGGAVILLQDQSCSGAGCAIERVPALVHTLGPKRQESAAHASTCRQRARSVAPCNQLTYVY